VAWFIIPEVLKRFTNIFVKTVFKKNSPNYFLLEKVFQSIEFLKELIECDSYFCYNWNLWMGQLTVNSIDWMVCSINWTVTGKLFLKLIWVFKGMGTIIFSWSKTFEKHSLRFSKWDRTPILCDHPLGKLFKSRNLQERESLSILEWGSCDFSSRPKLSLLHLIFILCNLFCVEVLCDYFWSYYSVICLSFSITGFVIELVQWVFALVSHLLRGSVECECCGEQCCLQIASVVVQWVSALVTH